MRRPRTARLVLAAVAAGGCAPLHSPLPDGAFITAPVAAPALPPPAPAAALPPAPAAPPRDPNAPLALAEVLSSVLTHFPLLYAVEQERGVAAGNRLAAEGGFDPVARVGGADRAGTFSSGVLNASVEQFAPGGGVSGTVGWRWGAGNFPVYNGGLKTADGGEFRAGVGVPLLQNRDIDPRRARLRAAQIAEKQADPQVRRARLDYARAAAQAYWAWQAAGGQYRVAVSLTDLARERQRALDARREAGEGGKAAVALNRRLLAGREEQALAAERAVQAAAVRLSLYLRDAAGDPVVPSPDALLARVIDLPAPLPDPARLAADVQTALDRRPELVRFQLEKERRAVDLAVARNQQQPELNLTAAAAQDVGFSKKTFTGVGPFATDRTFAEVGAALVVPIPFRAARGAERAAQAQLAQLLAQEKYQRDDIAAQVQDAVSDLVQTARRAAKAREELAEAREVLRVEAALAGGGQADLLRLNLQEVAAAEAQLKVIALVGGYHQAVAAYLAAVGADPAGPPPPFGVLPAAPATPAPKPGDTARPPESADPKAPGP